MSQFTYMGKSWEVDDQDCLRNPAEWTEQFAEGMARQLPGRLVGVSKDRHGTPAIRLALSAIAA